MQGNSPSPRIGFGAASAAAGSGRSIPAPTDEPAACVASAESVPLFGDFLPRPSPSLGVGQDRDRRRTLCTERVVATS